MNLSHYACNVIAVEYMNNINDGIQAIMMYVHVS